MRRPQAGGGPRLPSYPAISGSPNTRQAAGRDLQSEGSGLVFFNHLVDDPTVNFVDHRFVLPEKMQDGCLWGHNSEYVMVKIQGATSPVHDLVRVRYTGTDGENLTAELLEV